MLQKVKAMTPGELPSRAHYARRAPDVMRVRCCEMKQSRKVALGATNSVVLTATTTARSEIVSAEAGPATRRFHEMRTAKQGAEGRRDIVLRNTPAVLPPFSTALAAYRMTNTRRQ